MDGLARLSLDRRGLLARWEMVDHHEPERVAGHQFGGHTRPDSQRMCPPVSLHRAVAPCDGRPARMNTPRLPAVAPHLADYSGPRSHEASGDRSRPHAKRQRSLNQSTFLKIKVLVALRHMQLSPVSEMLHLHLESAVPSILGTVSYFRETTN
jgi:hypothetical protein